MKRFLSTISTKGQVTVPADIRRHLGVGTADRVAFVIAPGGTVELRPVHDTLESVLRSIKAMPNESLDLKKEINEATAEAMERFNPSRESR